MQLFAFTTLCLLLCSQTLAVRDLGRLAAKSLLQTTTSSSSSSSSFSINVVASSAATATSTTPFSVNEARARFASTIAVAIAQAEAGESAQATANEAVNAFAEGVASAFVEASVSIESTSPTATACGRVSVSAEASAEATARALIEVLAEASNPEQFTSVTDAIEAVESATVRAFASANVNACVNGVGQVDAMASQLAQSVASVSTQITAAILASVTPESAILQVDVTASGEQLIVNTVQGTSTVVRSGDGAEGEASTSFSTGPTP